MKSWRSMEKHLDDLVWEEIGESSDPEEFIEGFDIDWGIKELVVGLNLIGAETSGSCEGHFESVGRTPEIVRVNEFGKEFHEPIENPPLEGYWVNPSIDLSLGRTSEEGERIAAALQALIDEYYQGHENLPEIRVRLEKGRITRFSNYGIVAGDAEGTRAVSGTEDSKLLEQQALEKLENAQREIQGFSEFIKKKYLETGFHL